jgi:hypothetical protein
MQLVGKPCGLGLPKSLWQTAFLANLLPLLENAYKLIVGESNATSRKALRAKFAKVPLANRKIIE